jgi:hypothetical protein
MCSQINTATWKRLPVIGKSIKEILRFRERIRQLIRDTLKGKKYYGTTRFEGNYRLSFR